MLEAGRVEAGVITWRNVTVRLGDLKPWPRNPRQINKQQAARLAESFDQFGQVETIAIGPDLEVYNGHQRLAVLMQKHGADYQVEARQSDRALTEKEREKLTVFLHKGAAGEWDFDTLSEWDVPDLLDWGFSEQELGFGDTSTERDGQGVNTPWDQVNRADNEKVIIGEIETRLKAETVQMLSEFLEKQYTENKTPIYETLEAVIVAGVRNVESGCD